MTSVTVKDLIHGSEQRIGLVKTSAEPSLQRKVSRIRVQNYSRTGQLARHETLVMARQDMEYLGAAPPFERKNLLRQIISSGIPLIVLAEADELPSPLCDFSHQRQLPFLCSSFNEFLLETRLKGLLLEKLRKLVTIHGVLIDYQGIGILITGESGTGKTACARELTRSGYRWIADDVIVLKKNGTDDLHARGHKRTRHLLEIKGTGLVRVEDVFSREAVGDVTRLGVVISFDGDENEDDRFKYECRNIMGVEIPVLRMPIFRRADEAAVHIDRAVTTFVNRGVLT